MNALNPMAALQYKKHHTRKHRSQYPNMSCKRTKLVCIRKGFTQLFLVTALCIHRQVCQCYAGGGMNNGGSRGSPHSNSISISSSSNNNNSIGQHSLSPSTFHPLQPRAKFRKRNVNGRYDASGGGTAGSSKLYQSTAVTTIDDEGDDVQNRKGLSLRGGNDDASTEDKPIVKEEQQQHSIVEIENDDSASMAITNGEQQISIAQNFTTAVDDSTATMSSEEVDVITSEERKEPSIETTSTTTTTTTTPQVEQNAVVQKVETEQNRKWPCGDALDRQLIKIALPCIANFAINPLVGAVDLFWINRMGNTLAVAGQAAANQIFSSSFWLISFLPSGKIMRV